jgi:hypothetical protein
VGQYDNPICVGVPARLARNRVGIGLSYRPDRLHKLAESIPGLLNSLKLSLLAGNWPEMEVTEIIFDESLETLSAVESQSWVSF